MSDQTTDDILKKVQALFKEAMGNNVEVNINIRKNMVAEWDSINHLNLVVELESTYDLGLSMDEIEKLDSVKQIVDLIRDKKG